MKSYFWAVFVLLWTVVFLTLGGVASRMMDVQAQEKATPADTAPAMPADSAIKLRDAVIAQAKLVIQLKDTIATYNNLQGALNAQAKTLDDLKVSAVKAAKLDPEKWDVDTDNFKFIARPTPPAPPVPDKKP